MGKIIWINIIYFFIAKVKYFLSDKKISYAILAMVIGARVLQLLYFFNTRNDMTYQIIAAQNFYEGHGISSTIILPDDLSTSIYEPLIKWPPGFSVLFLPFYALLNENYIVAAITISILSAIALIFICRSTLKVLDTPVYLINLYTLLTGFSIYYFYNKPCTDATAITFFVTGLYFTLLLLKSNKDHLKKIVAIIVSLCICGSIKYLFIPVVFTIPLFLILKGVSDNNLIIKKAGIFSFLVSALAFGLLLAYQKHTSGSIAYIKVPERGFFPENLLAAHPFLLTSFLKPESIGILFKLQPGTTNSIFRIFQSIHFLLFLFLIIYTIKALIKNKFKRISQSGNFIYLSVIITLTISLLLAFLSLRVAKEPVEDGIFWTYVEEPRYYGLINVLLQMGVFVIYQYYRLKKSRLLKFIFYFSLILMMPEMFRGIIFVSRRVQYFNKEEYGWQQEYKFQKYTANIIKNEQVKQPIKNIVLIGSSDWMTLRASLYCGVPIFEDVNKINNLSTVNTSKPVLMLVILREIHLPAFKPFLSLKETRYIGSNSGFSFYINYLKPH